MTDPFCFLAQLDGLNPLNPTAPVTKSTGLVFMNVMAIVVTGLGLGLILLLCARYHVRKKKRRHQHSREQTTVSNPAPVWSDGEDQDERHGGRRRRRRHRRDHRPRNPTLGETGGLPPARPEPTSNPPQ